MDTVRKCQQLLKLQTAQYESHQQSHKIPDFISFCATDKLL